MPNVIYFLARSQHPIARATRWVRRAALDFTLPAPRVVVLPTLQVFLTIRWCFSFMKRVFVCEPLFKAYCTRHGRGVRTGTFVHWVHGKGSLVLGEQVVVEGKCSFTFAASYDPNPTLEIGDRTFIGHGCSFTIGKQISIGRHCLVATDVWMADSSGHPTDPVDRLAGQPTPIDKVRPITVGENVWIGTRSVILPGTTIGDGSVVSAGSVVRGEVPAYTIMAGNPARPVGRLPSPPMTDREEPRL